MTPTRDIVEHEATHVGVVKRLRPAAQLEQECFGSYTRIYFSCRASTDSVSDYNLRVRSCMHC